MSAKKGWFYKLSLATVVLGMVAISSVLITGQPAAKHHTGVVEDWSFHHLIYSNPGTYAQAIAKGTYDKWLKVQYDTRYIFQQMKRNRAAFRAAASPQMGTSLAARQVALAAQPKSPTPSLKGAWTMDMGASATVGANNYPAKYSFSVTSANCDSATQPDFVVYPTSQEGTSSSSTATGTIALETDPKNWTTGTVTVTIGPTGNEQTFTFVTSLGSQGTNTQVLMVTNAFVSYLDEEYTLQNLYAAINQTSSECYASPCYVIGTTAPVSVTSAAPTGFPSSITVTANGSYPGAAGNSINLLTDNDSDVELNGTTTTATTLTGGVTGTALPSIIAYDNIYSYCTTSPPFPNVYWQFATNYPSGGGGSDTSTVSTSPTLSMDGTQVAFIQSATAGASLVVLNWGAPESGVTDSPVVLLNTSSNNVSPATYVSTCRHTTTPCMTRITFSNSANDTNSAPYYDYANDVLYVGDNSGVLHKFTGVFNGTPAEITGGGTSSGWPQQMGAAGKILTSPVLDPVSGLVFVGSSAGTLSDIPGGGASTGGGSSNIVTSGTLATGTGIVAAPLVDPAASPAVVYVFVAADGDEGAGDACTTTHECSAAVWELNETFTSGADFGTGATEARLGSACASTTECNNAATYIGYDGTPDNIILNSAVGTGNLYACVRPAISGTPTLYQIPIVDNVLQTPVAGPALATASAGCSPITEFLDNTASEPLTLAITSFTSTTISVYSNTPFVINDYIQIDSEIMKITATPGTTSLTVLRGELGTTAADHSLPNTVTQFNDYLFLSVQNDGQNSLGTASTQRCGSTASGCLMSFDVTGGYTLSTTYSTSGTGYHIVAAADEAGGASGVIVDDSIVNPAAAPTGTSQIYFSTLSSATCKGNGTVGIGTGGCASQASQTGLD